jgi:hypothetical protein
MNENGLSAVLESNSEYDGEQTGMNKRKAKSSLMVNNPGQGGDFKTQVNNNILDGIDDEDDDGDILEELRRLQEFDPEATEQELKKKKMSRIDMNAIGMSPKAAKLKNKTAKMLASKKSLLDVSNTVGAGTRSGGSQPR